MPQEKFSQKPYERHAVSFVILYPLHHPITPIWLLYSTWCMRACNFPLVLHELCLFGRRIFLVHYLTYFTLFSVLMSCQQLCSYYGWLLLKYSAIGIGLNGVKTNCGIAHILGILLKNSYEFQILLEATFIYSLFPSNMINPLLIKVCLVKMAEHWPCSFSASLWTSTSSWSINT